MEDNFQTLNIKYKIKKIKNKKRNIQNIEPFETLSNISFSVDSPNGLSMENRRFAPPGGSAKRPPSSSNDNHLRGLSKDDESGVYGTHGAAEPHNNKEDKKEGMQTINDNDYEGLDDVISLGEEEGIIAHALTDFINRIYIGLITFNCLIAFSIANSTRKTANCGGDVPYTEEYTDSKTGRTKKRAVIDIDYITSIIEIDYGTVKYGQVVNTEPITGGNENLDPGLISDANAVYRYVCLFEAVIATFSFTYIWFYIIFYSYSNGMQNDTFFNMLNREKLRKSENVIVKILFFIFEFGIAVFEDVRWAVEKKFPEYALMLNRPFCFLVLFLIILDINHRYLSYLKDLLIDIIHINYKNFFVIILYLIVIYEFVNFWVVGNIEDAKKANSENPLVQTTFLMSLAAKVIPLQINPYMAIPIAIYKVIKELFRLIIAFVVSVPFGAVLCVFYFLYLSIIFPFFKVFKNDFINDIYSYIRGDGAFSDKDPCNIPMGFWENLGDNIQNSFSYSCMTIFNILPFLVPIIFSAYYIRIHLIDEMDCSGTKLFLQFFTFLILAIGILGLVWYFSWIVKALLGVGLTVFTILVAPPIAAMAIPLLFVSYLIKFIYAILTLIAIILFISFWGIIIKYFVDKGNEAKKKTEEGVSKLQ